jgi:hypothetical protein
VSWHDAQAYCTWRYASQSGHLPTEAQWELAARGGGQHLNINKEIFESMGDKASAVAAEEAKYSTYPWGEELVPNKTMHMSNVYQVLECLIYVCLCVCHDVCVRVCVMMCVCAWCVDYSYQCHTASYFISDYNITLSAGYISQRKYR